MGKLYDKQIKAVLGQKSGAVFELSDGGGLGIRVSPSGKVRWQFRYKIHGKNKRLDIASYPDMSLQQARETHQKYREWLAQGFDPKYKRDLEMESTLQPVTVKQALEYWLVEYCQHNRANFEKHRLQFTRHLYPYIGDYPLEQIQTRHWIECFDRIRKGINGKQKAAPVAAGYVMQNAKQALRFCRVRRYATSRVLDDLTIADVGKKQRKRDRFLSISELADVWLATQKDTLPAYYRNLVKLLIIFGARTQEVRLSKWGEWDFEQGLWTIPKTNSKTGTKIVRPIPVALKAWLKELKGNSSSSDYVLGEVKAPETVSQYGRKIHERLGCQEGWTLHDLRRTFATYLNELSVAPHVVEQLLGHTLGGVMGIYNRSQYLSEKQAALSMWIEHLDAIGVSDNKVSSILRSA
ncbi:tyrosine-type recombinase/integrase [Vibrio mediterranei]|uniref:tyrosine-type recombinase/integrase n=1 Tax=Vibrio mediterranei TaxID=689 RepID=UPI004068D48F